MARLTEQQIEDLQWDTAREYIRAYNDHKEVMLTHSTFSNESRASWKRLLKARKKYRDVAKKYARR